MDPDGASGFGRPAFSPHTGSWDAGPEPTGAPRAASEDDPGAVPGASDGTDAPFHGEPVGADETDDRDVTPEVPPATAAVIEDTLASFDDTARHATVICVANQKGGVGKTTTTVSLGAALAMEGAQVLVVDLDPQGNATTGLGLRAQEGAPSTYRVLVEQMDVEDATEPTAVRGLHVLPSSLDLAGAEIELVPAFSRENRLKQALDAVRDLYDVILIDCPPSLGLLTINALVAADQVLVPIQCEYYALEGLGQLLRTVKLVADSLNRGLAVGGVVLTMFDGRTNLSQQVVDEVRGYFGDIAYQTIVPRTVRLSEAPSYGQPIAVFDATSRGARAYQRLAREVARRLGLELEEEVSALDRLLGPAARPAADTAAPLPTDLDPEDVAAVPDAAPPPPDAGDGTPQEPSGAEQVQPFHGEREPAPDASGHGSTPGSGEEPLVAPAADDHGTSGTEGDDGDDDGYRDGAAAEAADHPDHEHRGHEPGDPPEDRPVHGDRSGHGPEHDGHGDHGPEHDEHGEHGPEHAEHGDHRHEHDGHGEHSPEHGDHGHAHGDHGHAHDEPVEHGPVGGAGHDEPVDLGHAPSGEYGHDGPPAQAPGHDDGGASAHGHDAHHQHEPAYQDGHDEHHQHEPAYQDGHDEHHQHEPAYQDGHDEHPGPHHEQHDRPWGAEEQP